MKLSQEKLGATQEAASRKMASLAGSLKNAKGLTAAAALAVLASCGLQDDEVFFDEGTGGSGGEAGSSTGSTGGMADSGTGGNGGTGGGSECQKPADCSTPDTDCKVATCEEGVCGESNLEIATLCGGDSLMCDGKGECRCQIVVKVDENGPFKAVQLNGQNAAINNDATVPPLNSTPDADDYALNDICMDEMPALSDGLIAVKATNNQAVVNLYSTLEPDASNAFMWVPVLSGTPGWMNGPVAQSTVRNTFLTGQHGGVPDTDGTQPKVKLDITGPNSTEWVIFDVNGK